MKQKIDEINDRNGDNDDCIVWKLYGDDNYGKRNENRNIDDNNNDYEDLKVNIHKKNNAGDELIFITKIMLVMMMKIMIMKNKMEI